MREREAKRSEGKEERTTGTDNERFAPELVYIRVLFESCSWHSSPERTRYVFVFDPL